MQNEKQMDIWWRAKLTRNLYKALAIIQVRESRWLLARRLREVAGFGS